MQKTLCFSVNITINFKLLSHTDLVSRIIIVIKGFIKQHGCTVL